MPGKQPVAGSCVVVGRKGTAVSGQRSAEGLLLIILIRALSLYSLDLQERIPSLGVLLRLEVLELDAGFCGGFFLCRGHFIGRLSGFLVGPSFRLAPWHLPNQ
jgi:hypothetical protein